MSDPNRDKVRPFTSAPGMEDYELDLSNLRCSYCGSYVRFRRCYTCRPKSERELKREDVRASVVAGVVLTALSPVLVPMAVARRGREAISSLAQRIRGARSGGDED